MQIAQASEAALGPNVGDGSYSSEMPAEFFLKTEVMLTALKLKYTLTGCDALYLCCVLCMHNYVLCLLPENFIMFVYVARYHMFTLLVSHVHTFRYHMFTFSQVSIFFVV